MIRRWSLAILAGLLVTACAPAFSVEDVRPQGESALPVPRSLVRFYNSAERVPYVYTNVAVITPRRRWVETDPKSLERYLKVAADHGATGLILDGSGHRPVLLAVAIDTTRLRTTSAVGTGAPPARASAPAGCQGSCPVHVRGYTRKDGTYVRPHTRSAPRSRRP